MNITFFSINVSSSATRLERKIPTQVSRHRRKYIRKHTLPRKMLLIAEKVIYIFQSCFPYCRVILGSFAFPGSGKNHLHKEERNIFVIAIVGVLQVLREFRNQIFHSILILF